MPEGLYRACPHRHATRITGIAGAITAALAIALTQASAAGPAPATLQAAGYVVLTATQLDATHLAYVGTFAVSNDGNGMVNVLRFTLSGGSLTDPSMSLPCQDAQAVTTSSASASVTTATFDVLSLDATIGGTRVAFSVATPPTDPFPSTVTLDNVQISAMTLTAGALTAPSAHIQASPC